MKQGQTLQELTAELDRQIETRKDCVAPQGQFEMLTAQVEDGSYKAPGVRNPNAQQVVVTPVLQFANGGGIRVYRINDHAHGQIASTLGIPRAYYDRMAAEKPELLAENVNAWLRAEPAKKRMIRTLDGNVRAVLSDRYRPLDNYDLMRTALPALTEMNAKIMSCAVTETRLYLKAIFPGLSEPAPDGMVYGVGHGNVERRNVAALILQNSEVGASTLRVEAGFFSTWCTNLAILSDAGMRKYHVGRSAYAELDAAVELFSSETRKADDTAFWMKVRDVISASCNAETFKLQMAKVSAVSEAKIESDNLPAVVEVAARKFGLGEGVKNAVLKHLIQAADLTQYGLLNAVTRASADVEDYDLATDLEKVGGKILELPKSDWAEIAQAA
jgi:hypothetical protein